MTTNQPKPAPTFGPLDVLAYHAKVHANEHRKAGKEAEAVAFEAAAKWLSGVKP